MSDDDLIRDAVHELVGAAPAPKPLPAGQAPAGRSYRWIAVAAAAILVIGGITAIAWSRAGDDDPRPMATTPPSAPTPTTLPSETTNVPASTAVSAPPSSAAPVDSTTTSTTTTPSTTTAVPDTVPPSPEAAVLVDYLAALAEGRYADAAVVLNEGGLEPERRADLQPLVGAEGQLIDLPAQLQTWCEQVAVCTAPDATPVDIGGYWVATWTTPEGVLTGYFRSSSFEGYPSVHGLPPRRAAGPVQTCPTTDVDLVREADVDGDGSVETLVVTHRSGSPALEICNTSATIPATPLSTQPVVIGVLQPWSDPAATLLIGEAGESGVCAATYRMAQSAGALVEVGWNGCWGFDADESIGCRDQEIVSYRYAFVGGSRIDDSTAIDVEVLTLDGAPLDQLTLTLPDQAEEALRIIEPHCNGRPAVTEG